MYQLRNLTGPGEHLPLIFCYDYLPNLPSTLKPSTWNFDIPREQPDESPIYHQESFPLYPQATNLPFHSGLATVRASRFHNVVIEYTEGLYRTFAMDKSLHGIPLLNGMSLADIATRQLKKPPIERFIVQGMHLVPYADEERARLIAGSAVLLVFLDDAQQEIKTNILQRALGDFNNRLVNGSLLELPQLSPFQNFVAQLIQEFRSADATADTGGHDVINTMCEWIIHEQPKGEFDSVSEYMKYRWNDSAFKWTCACVKFSIASNADLDEAELSTFMQLAGNHFSLVNDLASFEKELQEFKSGKAVSLINVVDVLQREHGIDIFEAKLKAYSMQLETENQIKEELERLKAQGLVTLEEWRFIDAVMVMLAGHVFYSMTTSRFGGEASRISSCVRL